MFLIGFPLMIKFLFSSEPLSREDLISLEDLGHSKLFSVSRRPGLKTTRLRSVKIGDIVCDGKENESLGSGR